MDKKVLVTGTSGFIGTTFAERFHETYDLMGVDRTPPRERFPGVDYAIADVTDENRIQHLILEEEPDAIVHLAARARVKDGKDDPIGTYRVNVHGTTNLLEAAAQVPDLEKFVYISSEQVYGEVETYPTPEHLGPGEPDNVYAASKASADLFVQQFHPIQTVVARSAMGAGPRSSPHEQVISKFIQNILNGDPLLFPEGNPDHPTRDVSPAWNFVGGLGRILETPNAEGVYNLGSGRELSILEIAEIIVDEIGEGEIQETDGFSYRPGEEGFRTWLDNSRARKELDYDPEFSLEEVVQLTADWLQEHPDYWDRERVPHHHAWKR